MNGRTHVRKKTIRDRNITTKYRHQNIPNKTYNISSQSIRSSNKTKFENLKKKKRYAFKFNESDML